MIIPIKLIKGLLLVGESVLPAAKRTYKILLAISIIIALVFVAKFVLAHGVSSRVSTASDGTEANSHSHEPSLSDDGRYVAFQSHASNLVPNDTNAGVDIFLKDVQTGAVSRISTDSSGNQASGESFDPMISCEATYVVFESDATNLVANDTNGKSDIFLKNVQTGATTRISTDSNGAQANSDSYLASIAHGDRYIAFESDASNLVPGDTNGQWDIFVKDVQTGTTTRVSTDSSGNQANGPSHQADISSDGRYVVFYSDATNLVTNDQNGNIADIFIKDTQTNATSKVSIASDGTQTNAGSALPTITDDGRYVAFNSEASNLVASDNNGITDAFVKDVQTGSIERVSTSSSGTESNAMSQEPQISDHGHYVGFFSLANNLVANDTNGTADTFIKHIPTGHILRASVNASGVEGNGYSNSLSITEDGHFFAIVSNASNLAPNDTNGVGDVFLMADEMAPTNPVITSSTHPSNSKYYKNNSPSFSWSATDSSGVDDYSYVLNKSAATEPDETGEGASASKSYSGLGNGRWYFHVKASDIFHHWSSTKHFRINIDKYRPRTYAPYRKKVGRGSSARLYWKVKDPHTGNRAVVTIKIQRKRGKKYYTKKIKRYGLTTINRLRYFRNKFNNPGIYRLLVYAKDRAGNRQYNVARNYIKVYDRPKTYAPYRQRIKRGSYAKLYWKVYAPYTGNEAAVTIVIQKKVSSSKYKTRKMIRYDQTTINILRYYLQRFDAPGTYRFLIYAKDNAGHSQYNVAKNYVIVE